MDAQSSGCAFNFSGIELHDEIADDGVAFARRPFQAFAIDDLNPPTAVPDQAAALQLSGGKGDAGAAGAEHFCEKLLGQFEAVRLKAVADHQQPASEAFFDLVEAMTGCQLAENKALALHTFQNALGKRPGCEEQLLQIREGHAQGGPLTLDEGRGRGRGRSQQADCLNEAFTANHADFGSYAVGHKGDDGSNSGGHEVRKLGNPAGVGEYCSNGQFDGFQTRKQRRLHTSWKGVNDQI